MINIIYIYLIVITITTLLLLLSYTINWPIKMRSYTIFTATAATLNKKICPPSNPNIYPPCPPPKICPECPPPKICPECTLCTEGNVCSSTNKCVKCNTFEDCDPKHACNNDNKCVEVDCNINSDCTEIDNNFCLKNKCVMCKADPDCKNYFNQEEFKQNFDGESKCNESNNCRVYKIKENNDNNEWQHDYVGIYRRNSSLQLDNKVQDYLTPYVTECPPQKDTYKAVKVTIDDHKNVVSSSCYNFMYGGVTLDELQTTNDILYIVKEKK